MAKQKVFILVGLPHSGGDLLTAALELHRDALTEQKVMLPAKSEEEMFRAAVEIRREHRAWALRRKDVEGTWSKVCRRATATRDTIVVGHDLLAGATPDEIALLVDRLPGMAVHVVVTVGMPDARVALFPDELDLASVTWRWSGAVRSPDRLHVIAVEPAHPRHAWRSLGRVVGFATAGLELPEPAGALPRIDPATLRLIADSAGSHLTDADLSELIGSWAKLMAEQGYDVHGDLDSLTPEIGPGAEDDPVATAAAGRLAVVNDALSDAVAEVGRLREQVADLEQRNAKLERKRRKLKSERARTEPARA